MRIVPTSAARLDRLRRGAVVVPDAPAIIRIEGPGAVSCLQGLLTNDVETAGDGAFVYGALLTPKGAIVVDLWAMRQDGGFLLVLDRAGLAAALELFQARLPPRLAQTTDQSATWRACWLLGPGAGELGERTIGPVAPAEGGSSRIGDGDDAAWVGRGGPAAPFRWLIAAPESVIDGFRAKLASTGPEGDAADLLAARVIAGFPTLGAEIGQKTLPQEVRYDEIDGVSYTKGCYVGQETVARLHFRGHPNWMLRGVQLPAGPIAESGALTLEGKRVGTLTTVLDPGDGNRIGLASVRREVDLGRAVDTHAGPAIVVRLPFGAERRAG